jgi:hypothetical protein
MPCFGLQVLFAMQYPNVGYPHAVHCSEIDKNFHCKCVSQGPLAGELGLPQGIWAYCMAYW